MKKLGGLIVDLLIIIISFEVSEYVAETLFHTTRWWVEMLLYLAVYMVLQGIVWLIKHAWKAKVRKNADSEE